MEKLELKHLAPYLPYGLKVYSEKNGIKKMKLKIEPNPVGCQITMDAVLKYDIYKPILRPLSDLKKYENELYLYCGVVKIDTNLDVDFTGNYSEYNSTDLIGCLKLLNKLFELHFDVFGLIDKGLIDKGLAIDINTLKN
jgi:hypothetical protein